MTIDQYFQTLTGFSPRQFQLQTIHTLLNRQAVLLRVPTGSGKTETAIALDIATDITSRIVSTSLYWNGALVDNERGKGTLENKEDKGVIAYKALIFSNQISPV